MKTPSRRSLLAGTVGALVQPIAVQPIAAQPVAAPAGVAFFAWSVVEPLLRAEIAAFQRSTRRTVQTTSLPWAAYREALVSRLIGGTRVDVVAMSDLWLPEFAERGWLAPLDDLPGIAGLASETRPLCTQGMRWRGRRYGLPYYADSITFLYNRDLLDRAGISQPPTTWDEVVAQGRQLQARGLVRHALGIPLDDDPWLVEVITALVYAHGGRYVAEDGSAMMADPRLGCVPALRFLREAITGAAILPPLAPHTAEAEVMEAMAEGEHAFCLLPSYRMRALNDDTQSAVAGRIKAALMPRGGPDGRHETCGWVRFFAITADAMADPVRREAAEAFLLAIGGSGVAGDYALQRRLLVEGGLPFCAQPLLRDPEIEAMLDRWTGSTAIIRQQGTLSRPKDLIHPWTSRWLARSSADIHDALDGRVALEAATARMAERWMAMRAEHV